MPTQKKADLIAQIKDDFSNASAIFMVDYNGFTVKQAEQLRGILRGHNAEFKVYKNTLARIALRELELPEMEDKLVGPTAFVFARDDAASPAKDIKTYAAANQQITIKGGLMDGQALGIEEVNAIAELPSHDQLIAMLLNVMQSPMAQFVRVLQGPAESFARVLSAIGEQKEAA